jgi:hypothetical protein
MKTAAILAVSCVVLLLAPPQGDPTLTPPREDER